MAGDCWTDPEFLEGLQAAGVQVLAPPQVQAGHCAVKTSWADRAVLVDAIRGLEVHPFLSPSRSSVEVWSTSGLLVHVILEWSAPLVASAVAAVARGSASLAEVRDGSWAAWWTPRRLGTAAEQLLDAGVFASEVPARVLREDLAGRLLADASADMWRSGVPAAVRSNACQIFAHKLLESPELLRTSALLDAPAPSSQDAPARTLPASPVQSLPRSPAHSPAHSTARQEPGRGR